MGVTRFGGPESLQEALLPDPMPGAGEVLVRLYAAAVNPADVLLRQGAMADLLAAVEPPYVPGMDGAGVVEQIGDDTDGRLRVGDEVVLVALPALTGRGTYAEKIAVPAASVVHAPGGVDAAHAGAFLLNALTSDLALDALKARPGERVLVTGATGAVGGFAVQLAAAAGLEVNADAAPADRQFVTDLGAIRVLERGPGLVSQVLEVWPGGVDGVIDGAAIGDSLMAAVRDSGRFAAVRDLTQQPGRGITATRIRYVTAVADTARLQRLADLVAGGVLVPRVAQTYPLSEAGEAHRRLAVGGLRGRLVLTID